MFASNKLLMAFRGWKSFVLGLLFSQFVVCILSFGSPQSHEHMYGGIFEGLLVQNVVVIVSY